MKIETWTIRNEDGEIIVRDISDIIEWQKNNHDALVVARFDSIKEMVIR